MSEANKPQDAPRLFSASATDAYDTSAVVWMPVGEPIGCDATDVWPFTCWGDDALKTKEA